MLILAASPIQCSSAVLASISLICPVSVLAFLRAPLPLRKFTFHFTPLHSTHFGSSSSLYVLLSQIIYGGDFRPFYNIHDTSFQPVKNAKPEVRAASDNFSAILWFIRRQ